MNLLKQLNGQILTIPNMVSISRIFLLPPFIFFLKKYHVQTTLENLLIIFVIALIAILTDFLDGFLARKLNMESKLGGFLDGLADHILIFILIIFLLIDFNLPFWLVTIYISRETIGILVEIHISRKHEIITKANMLGKISTNAAALCILWYVSYPYLRTILAENNPLMFPVISAYLYAFFLIASMIFYFVQYRFIIFSK